MYSDQVRVIRKLDFRRLTENALLADLRHLADASQVGIDVQTERIQVPARLADVGSALGADPLPDTVVRAHAFGR